MTRPTHSQIKRMKDDELSLYRRSVYRERSEAKTLARDELNQAPVETERLIDFLAGHITFIEDEMRDRGDDPSPLYED